MKQKIIDSLTKRLSLEVSKKNPVYFLNNHLPFNDIADLAISSVYLYTRSKKGTAAKSILMTEVICAIGHSVRDSYKLKRDSAVAAKIGAFILYTFEQLGLLHVKMGAAANHHQTYVIEVLQDDKISELWESLPIDKIDKFPSLTPYADWATTKHATGTTMVKTASQEVLEKVTPETHPMLFESLNKSQHIGWQINQDIYPIYTWALRNKADAFSDIWEMQSAEARTSKIREATAIGVIAKRFLNETFYHLYTYDFRGRKYNSTAYLHEQGTDLSKGLIYYAKKRKITEQGFFWLMISIASNWAGSSGREDNAKTDKIPLNDRVYWALDNEEILLSYAESPKVNQGWMKAEKPWQFLAACFELAHFRMWQAANEDSEDIYGYESGLVVYIDGSNNGSQHLSALTRDEVTAPHVNLVPSDLPGDLYKYVADHVWTKVEEDLRLLSAEEIAECNEVINTTIDLKQDITRAPAKSKERQTAIDEMAIYRDMHRETIKKASPVFWGRIKDGKDKRKICKR